MGWLSGWNYRKSHVINSASGAGTNYQVRIKVHYGSGDISFSFGSPTNIKSNNAHQGITTDGTYVYTTRAVAIYKYQKDGTLVTSRDTSNDGTYDHMTDLCYKDGKLYVGCCNWPDTPRKGSIMVYNASDLSYVGEWLYPDDGYYVGGVCFDGTHFWAFLWDGSDRKIAKLNQTDTTTFEVLATYTLDYPMTQKNYGYQGGDWYGNYLFCNNHEGDNPDTCDVYYFNGSGFEQYQRIDHVTWDAVGYSGTATATQGLAIENDNGTYYVWWASRGAEGSSNDFAKTLLMFGEDVYLNSHCRTDFGDVRFTGKDASGNNPETNLLDYWIEKKVDSDYAVFWVELQYSLDSENQTIYIYYGKSDATYSNPKQHGENTFIFFDNFEGTSLDSDKWSSGGDVSVSDGVVTIISSSTTSAYIEMQNYISEANCRFEQKCKWSNFNVRTVLVLKSESGDDNANIFSEKTGSDGETDVQWNTNINGSWGTEETVLNDSSADTYYILVMERQGSHFKPYVYDTNRSQLGTCNARTVVNENFKRKCFVQAGSTTQLTIDWIFVRKYVDPEPTHGSWGDEETITITITDSISLTDSASRIKLLIITDSISASDQTFGHKTLNITDITQLLEEILHNKTFPISDSINLSDQIFRHKTFSINDVIQLLDQITRDKSFTLSDTISLSDLINVTIQIFKTVTDSIQLSDQTIVHKTFTISDLVQLTGQILHNKSLTISDSISISDAITVLTETLKTVMDSIGLSDEILTDKIFTVTDVIQLAGQIFRHKTFSISDQISLTDQTLRDKIVEIADQISLVESILSAKLFTIIDQIGLTDTVKIVQMIKVVSDAITITEQVLIHKKLTVQDQIALSELVTILGAAVTLIKILVQSLIPVKIETESFTPLKIESEEIIK